MNISVIELLWIKNVSTFMNNSTKQPTTGGKVMHFNSSTIVNKCDSKTFVLIVLCFTIFYRYVWCIANYFCVRTNLLWGLPGFVVGNFSFLVCLYCKNFVEPIWRCRVLLYRCVWAIAIEVSTDILVLCCGFWFLFY